MMKLITTLTLICSILIGCGTQTKSNQLVYDPIVINVFDGNSISSLTRIVSVFDSCILKVNGINSNDIATNYQTCFERVARTESYDFLEEEVALSKSPEVQELLIDLKNQKQFDNIFKEVYHGNRTKNDTIALFLDLNYNGRFKLLLESLCEEEEIYSEYVLDINIIGGYSPSSIAYLMKIYSDVDFSRELNRLVFAVHYIAALSEIRYD